MNILLKGLKNKTVWEKKEEKLWPYLKKIEYSISVSRLQSTEPSDFCVYALK